MMEGSTDSFSGNEWELSKENVQPLKKGRRMANLTAALAPSLVDQSRIYKEKQLVFFISNFKKKPHYSTNVFSLIHLLIFKGNSKRKLELTKATTLCKYGAGKVESCVVREERVGYFRVGLLHNVLIMQWLIRWMCEVLPASNRNYDFMMIFRF